VLPGIAFAALLAAAPAAVAAPLDWCVAPRREHANHPPVAALGDDASPAVLEVDAAPGAAVLLDASSSVDPDGDALTFRWLVYGEAGEGPPEPIAVEGALSPHASVRVPRPTGLRSFHVVLEVTDRGSPPLTRYRRAVVRVRGAATR
jgi:hypothetical protein